mmetsp:Transcript_65473/g.188674  ORF Transcript_65473/g.188674 Transcript_65473/m.188674 type:complete len:694 (+) Transcript_65473:2581-4662(+)
MHACSPQPMGGPVHRALCADVPAGLVAVQPALARFALGATRVVLEPTNVALLALGGAELVGVLTRRARLARAAAGHRTEEAGLAPAVARGVRLRDIVARHRCQALRGVRAAAVRERVAAELATNTSVCHLVAPGPRAAHRPRAEVASVGTTLHDGPVVYVRLPVGQGQSNRQRPILADLVLPPELTPVLDVAIVLALDEQVFWLLAPRRVAQTASQWACLPKWFVPRPHGARTDARALWRGHPTLVQVQGADRARLAREVPALEELQVGVVRVVLALAVLRQRPRACRVLQPPAWRVARATEPAALGAVRLDVQDRLPRVALLLVVARRCGPLDARPILLIQKARGVLAWWLDGRHTHAASLRAALKQKALVVLRIAHLVGPLAVEVGPPRAERGQARVVLARCEQLLLRSGARLLAEAAGRAAPLADVGQRIRGVRPLRGAPAAFVGAVEAHPSLATLGVLVSECGVVAAPTLLWCAYAVHANGGAVVALLEQRHLLQLRQLPVARYELRWGNEAAVRQTGPKGNAGCLRHIGELRGGLQRKPQRSAFLQHDAGADVELARHGGGGEDKFGHIIFGGAESVADGSLHHNICQPDGAFDLELQEHDPRVRRDEHEGWRGARAARDRAILLDISQTLFGVVIELEVRLREAALRLRQALPRRTGQAVHVFETWCVLAPRCYIIGETRQGGKAQH